MHIDLFVKYSCYSCQMLMEIWSARHIFEKSSHIKFKEYPSSCNRVVLCGQTDMTELIVAFRNFLKASKNYSMRKVLRVAGILRIICKVHNYVMSWELLISRTQWEFQTRRGQQYRPRVVPKNDVAIFGMKKSLGSFFLQRWLPCCRNRIELWGKD